jgi:hypothetical protein
MSPALAILIAVLAQAPAPRPSAAQDKARAQVLLNEGADLYDLGNLVEALGRFQSAYAAYPSPKLWFNIGQAQRDLGRHVEAMEAFERFLSEAKDAPVGTLGEAHRSVSELRLKLGRITISCPTRGALVSIDGTRVGTTPMPAPMWLAPGTHQIGVGRYDLAPAVQRIVVVPGREATITFQLHVAEAKPSVVVPTPSSPPPSPAAVLAAPPPTPAPALPPPAAFSPTVLVAEPTPQRGMENTIPEGEASWPSLAHNWRFWASVSGAVVLTSIIFGIANSGGGSNTPTTTLGSQRAF